MCGVRLSLRILERVLETDESPISEADFIQTLENLEKIKVVLTADQRLVRNCRSQGYADCGSGFLSRDMPGDIKAPKDIVMSVY